MEITIKGKDKKLLQLVEQLAKELGLSITSCTKSNKPLNNNGEELYKLMAKKAKAEGIKSIKDPVKWQKKTT